MANIKEWKNYCQNEDFPVDVPKNPQAVYKNKGWLNWHNWLAPKSKWLPFEDAREYARGLGISSVNEWRAHCKTHKIPEGIPVAPNVVYENSGWVNWVDWIGGDRIAYSQHQWRDFRSARKYVHSLKLPGKNDWEAFSKSKNRPSDIPSNPNVAYKDKGWSGLGDWLGTRTVATNARKYRSFNAAKAFVRVLCLKNQGEWYAYCQGKLPEKGPLPSDIPASPHWVYRKKGWKGFGDWLGTGRTRVSKSAKRKS